jgi:serine/threonine-protein kinase
MDTSRTAPSLATGEVIDGKYRIEAVIGRGGTSVVYRATQLRLERQVALKVLVAEAARRPESVARMVREARAVSRIRSERVVHIHDLGALPDGGAPFLVMEHLQGHDLAAALAQSGRFPLPLAVECMMQSCEALAAAHALGIIHRDLKPANLFLVETEDGSPCVKLLDFGIARLLGPLASAAHTDPGIVLGTPSFMAPEQIAASHAADSRSDIWALGAIFYALLTGHPPFTGESLTRIYLNILRTETPRPSREREDLSPSVDDIVARCLAVEPDDRFQSATELAWALSAVAAPHARDGAARVSRVPSGRVSSAHRGGASAPSPPSSTVRRLRAPALSAGPSGDEAAGAPERRADGGGPLVPRSPSEPRAEPEETRGGQL